jgi:hypothetical protein
MVRFVSQFEDPEVRTSICKSEFPISNHLWKFSIDDLFLTKDSEFQKLIFIRDFYIVNLTLSLD